MKHTLEENKTMKNMTKKLVLRVREALLALSDKILYAILLTWLEQADEQLLYEECQPGNGRAMYPELADEFRFALGYRLVSEATGNKYSSVEQLGASDEDCTQITMMKPGEEELREIVASLSIQEFYHIVIALSGYALAEKTADDQWGPAPSRGCDGYEFMRNLCIWLEGMKEPIGNPYEDMKAEYESMGLEWEDSEMAVQDRFGDVIAVFGGDYGPQGVTLAYHPC